MRIAIIGSGFSGLCLASHLKRAGVDTFTIYEKAGTIGACAWFAGPGARQSAFIDARSHLAI